MSILFFADSHLQESAWTTRAVAGDAAFALEQIVTHAVTKKVSAVVGAGDLIDKQRNRAYPIREFFRQLDRLRDANIPFYFIQGQHDRDNPTWLSAHAHATHLHGRHIMIDGVTIYGMDWQPADRIHDEFAQIPVDTDILVSHQVWGEFMGGITTPEANFSDVPHVSTIFTGDLHVHKVFHTTGKTGQPLTVYSPGSTCRQSIDEQPDKYFMIHADEHWMVGELKVRPTLDDVEITDDPTLDKYLSELPARIEQLAAESEHLPPHIRRPYLRVKYNAELHDAARRLEAACVDKVHLFLKETPKAKERLVVSAPTTNVEVLTPTSLLRLAVDPEEDPRLFSVVSRFLAATNVDAELEALRQEWLRRDDVHQEIDSVECGSAQEIGD